MPNNRNIKSIVVSNPKDGKTINRGVYDEQGEFIMYQEGFKDLQKDIPNAIPLNELGMQNFLKTAGSNAKNLKAAFLTDVRNQELWAIVKNNYNDKEKSFDNVLTFERGSAQFNRIMGSPNFRSKMYGYGNHHNAIGGKVPNKVIVVPKQAQADDPDAELILAVVFA